YKSTLLLSDIESLGGGLSLLILPRKRSTAASSVSHRELIAVLTALVSARDSAGGYPPGGIALLTRQLCAALHIDAEESNKIMLASRLYDLGALTLPDNLR